MATVTSCPSCSEKLRLPDAMLGQKVPVRSAATSSRPAIRPPPRRSNGGPAWRRRCCCCLRRQRRHAPHPSARGNSICPWTIVPLNCRRCRHRRSLNHYDGKRRRRIGPAVVPAVPATTRVTRSKFAVRFAAGRMRAAARRCYHCGERLTDSPPDAWVIQIGTATTTGNSAAGNEIPHRGGLVLAMGIVSLVMLVVFTGLGLPFGIVGWWRAEVDLASTRQADGSGRRGHDTNRLDSQHHRHRHEWSVHPWLRRLFRVHYHGCGVCQHASTRRTFVPTTAPARAVQHQAPAQSVGERSEQGFPEGQVRPFKELAGSTSVAVPICQPRLRG